jgi:hypothetical protein
MFGGIIEAGKRQTRNGNAYDPVTGARVTVLNPAGAAYPAMEVYKFDTLEALDAAAAKYNGNTRAFLWNGRTTDWANAAEQGPWDYFVQLDSDIGPLVRCDKDGIPTTVLQTLKPDNSGVVNTQETGPGGARNFEPNKVFECEYNSTLPNYERMQTSGFGPGSKAVIGFTIGGGRYADKLSAVEKPGTTVTTRHATVTAKTGDQPAMLVFDDDTGASVELTFGKPGGFGKPGDRVRVEITSPGYDGQYGPCDLDIDVHGPGR